MHFHPISSWNSWSASTDENPAPIEGIDRFWFIFSIDDCFAARRNAERSGPYSSAPFRRRFSRVLGHCFSVRLFVCCSICPCDRHGGHAFSTIFWGHRSLITRNWTVRPVLQWWLDFVLSLHMNMKLWHNNQPTFTLCI
jgi:hypothetical protein